MHTRTSITAGIFLLGATISGCAHHLTEGEWASYPGHAQERAVDVQAFRDDHSLAFTNTTPDTLGPGRLWINAAYSIDIDAVAPGERASIDLNDCRNEYGQAFRGGGFFATERPDAVVLAQIEDERGGMTGLLVTTRPSGPK